MKKILFLLLLILMFLIFLFCERKTDPASANTPPNTTLANIPVEGDTLFALITLHWDGEDDDGFIAGYEYRYITRHYSDSIGGIVTDSVIQDWEFTQATSIIIPFESSALMNHQRFQVRAIDDQGAVDPEPAERQMYTVQTIFPETEILTPRQNQQFFVLADTSDWWWGVPLIFQASDKDGEVVEFAWAVDDGEWNWMDDTTTYIKPDYFVPLDGEHVIRVSSRDNTNLVDPLGDSVIVKLIEPTFSQDILLIDETDESLFSFGLSFTDAEIDSFYARVFGTHDIWNYYADGMPPKEILGQYRLVVWYADNLYTNEVNFHKLPLHINDWIDYLNVGGDFVMSGWRILKSFAHEEDFPKTFEAGSFIHDYLHILQADETPLDGDFTHAKGYFGFSDIRVDSLKLSEWPFQGKLAVVNVMPQQAPFAYRIFTYQNDPFTGIGEWRDNACGIRYIGTSFNLIAFGFPLFFMVEEDVQQMVSEMLQLLDYE